MKYAASVFAFLVVAGSCSTPELIVKDVPPPPVKISTSVPLRPLPAPESDTIEVEGDYCAGVKQTCLRYLDPESKLRCAEFASPSVCSGRSVRKHFFIDRYEYPNRAGEKPKLMVTWTEASDSCRANGKRLCTASEWTLACEGPDMLPYPYGYERDPSACNIDRDTRSPSEKAIGNPATRDAEVDRLDQRVPSGSDQKCVSPYGVRDMTGNVDEWVVNESGLKDRAPYESGLKGGYWGPVRTRCRPMTVAHGPSFAYYQIGFRCCSDAGRK